MPSVEGIWLWVRLGPRACCIRVQLAPRMFEQKGLQGKKLHNPNKNFFSTNLLFYGDTTANTNRLCRIWRLKFSCRLCEGCRPPALSCQQAMMCMKNVTNFSSFRQLKLTTRSSHARLRSRLENHGPAISLAPPLRLIFP